MEELQEQSMSMKIQVKAQAQTASEEASFKSSGLQRVCNCSQHNPLESHFGYDFSQVPIYSSTTARVQEKLAINHPGDQDEQEADRIAQQVIHMPDHISLPIQIGRASCRERV